MLGRFVGKYTTSETWIIFAGKDVVLRIFYCVTVPFAPPSNRSFLGVGPKELCLEVENCHVGYVLCSAREGTEWLGEGSVDKLQAVTSKGTKSVSAK